MSSPTTETSAREGDAAPVMATVKSMQDVQMMDAFRGDGSTQELLYSQFVWFDEDDHAWVGRNTTKSLHELTLEDINHALRQLPDETAFPAATPGLTTVAEEEIDLSKHYIKRPDVIKCLDGNSTIAQRGLVEEIHILEKLRAHPHPNIMTYHGCVVKRGRLTGMVLHRYGCTSWNLFKSDASSFDVTLLEQGLNAAVAHIHALGLAHNDINPTNIALDEERNAILIDWGSCRPFGERLISSGAVDWIDDDYDFFFSRQEHDLRAVKKVIAWALEEKAKNAE